MAFKCLVMPLVYTRYEEIQCGFVGGRYVFVRRVKTAHLSRATYLGGLYVQVFREFNRFLIRAIICHNRCP